MTLHYVSHPNNSKKYTNHTQISFKLDNLLPTCDLIKHESKIGGKSHIDFRMQCVIMTLAGAGLSLITF